ncbi:unnamed protein product [Symbiodinium microadriaticum]|nr:unnamed protein product [Symbiodinium microadriaticum]
MTQFSGKAGDYNKYLSEYGGPQADYDQYVSLYASMAGPGVTSGSNYKGKGSEGTRVGAMAEGIAEVTFEVSLLSGTTASISCPADASLGSLVHDIGLKLGLMKEKQMPSLLFLPSSAETGAEPLQETVTAGELANQSIVAGVHAEPGWCTQKCFKKFWIHGRHCGMEEDSEDFVLKLYAGGKFNYSEKFHSHDAENGYNYDRKTDASGTWRLIRRDVGKEDLEEAIYLEGTATYHTVESHVRTCYNEDDELPEGMDETVTEKFTLSFAKAALLTPDAGRHRRGGWTVTDLPPQTPTTLDAGAASSSG